MAIPDNNAVFIHKGYNCSSNVIPTAQSIPISSSDNTSVKDALSALSGNIAPGYDNTLPYSVGDYVIYDNLLYKCITNISVAEEWTPAHWEAVKVTDEVVEIYDELDSKADTDGTYDQMTVGNSLKLVNTRHTTEKVPYLFRPSGGDIHAYIGESEEDTLVGGTVAFNQICVEGDFPNDITAWNMSNGTVNYSDNKATMLATAQNGYLSTRFKNTMGHCYLIMATIDTTVANKVSLRVLRTVTPYDNKNAQNTSGSKQTVSMIHKTSYDTAYYEIRIVDTRSSDWDNVIISNVNIIDLTQMFGSTIADYIYSLEQGTAGAGVAWFRNLFPKDYYAYNAGELMSVKTSKHIMTGFNQWDEQWELGAYSIIDGTPISSTTQIRSKNTFKILPNTSYYAYIPLGSIWAFFYDTNDNLINTPIPNTDKSGYAYSIGRKVFTTPINAVKCKFYCTTNYGTTYNHDICINLSWDGERDGEYEPYVKYEYPLDSNLELRGIPKLDANNKLYYDGDTYESDGTVMRKYGVVDLGTLTWDKVSISDEWVFRCLNFVDNYNGVNGTNTASMPNLICKQYTTHTTSYSTIPPNKNLTMGCPAYFNKSLVVHDETYSDAASFKTAMSGVYLVYELATPTTEEAEPFTNPQKVNDFGTEEYEDNRTIPIPVGHDTDYLKDYEMPLPLPPETAGTYALNLTVSATREKTFSWESTSSNRSVTLTRATPIESEEEPTDEGATEEPEENEER